MPGLEDLYREIILDHYRNPRNRGELESPPALRAEGFNPLCGDEVVKMCIRDSAVGHPRISGCSLDLCVQVRPSHFEPRPLWAQATEPRWRSNQPSSKAMARGSCTRPWPAPARMRSSEDASAASASSRASCLLYTSRCV